MSHLESKRTFMGCDVNANVQYVCYAYVISCLFLSNMILRLAARLVAQREGISPFFN